MKLEQTTQGRQQKGTLRDLLYVLFGHKWKILIFTILLFSAATVTTFLRPNIYRSEAQLLLRLGRESVALDPTASIGEITHINRSYDWEINSELQILKSRDIAERVVDELGVEAFQQKQETAAFDPNSLVASKPVNQTLQTAKEVLNAIEAGPAKLTARVGLAQPLSEREKAVRKLQDGLEAKAVQNANVINLAYEEQSPIFAADVLTKFIQAYLEKHLAVYCIADSQRFFEQQVSDLRTKLDAAEGKLEAMKNTTGISSLPEQRAAKVTLIGDLEHGISTAEAELTAANAKIAKINDLVAGIPDTVIVEETSGFSDYGADLMRSKLYELRIAEKDIEAKYTPDSWQLDMIRKQIKEGTDLLQNEQSKPNRTEVKKGVNAAYQQMQMTLLAEQSNVSGLQSKLATMRAQAAQAKASLQTMNQVETQTGQLQREITLLTESYNRYAGKLEEARIDHALKAERISNVSVLQAATVPTAPIGPQKILRLALGLLLAIVGGVGFAFLCEYMDHSIKTPEDVQERLQLPTLASIPRASLNTVSPVLKSNGWKKFGVVPAQAGPVQWDIPASVRRHYMALREQLLLGANGSAPGHYVVGVTSNSRSEGVSTVAANLASALSEQGNGTTVLVDANTRHPFLHRIFRTRLSPGLVDALTIDRGDGQENTVVRRTTNLSILTAGSIGGSSAKIPPSDDLAHLLDAARQNYRFIVVDMPALEEDSSVARLAASCDGVVLVVETERLRWESISRTKQRLTQHNSNVLGVLLNKRRFPVPNWVYAAL
jgi:capsular exopolysaccharide synthesis family protein